MLHPQVETLLLVVESGSFSRAAAARGCSTVAVMNQVNALEERLGFRVLARSPRGVALTEAGEVFCRASEKLREEAARAVGRARRLSAQEKPVVRLGTSLLRPCRPVLELLEKRRPAWRERFQIRMVPFSDSPEEFARLRHNLGGEIDCFASPCDSAAWQNEHGILPLGTCRCCVTLPATHPLAAKHRLAWADLAGETLLLVRPGMSPTLDRLREDITRNQPDIAVMDAPEYYDIEVFNRCERGGYVMETPEVWAGLHPALVTLPVDWDYAQPYGIVYAKSPSPAVALLIEALGGVA